MLGRPRESARLAGPAVEVIRRYGIEHSTLLANQVEALVATGEWDEADSVSAAALRAITANWPHQALIRRAELETGRGDFDAARAHLEAALANVREDPDVATYDASSPSSPSGSAAGRTPTRPSATVWHGRGLATAAQIRVWLCAKGLRAQAELAALARARRDADAVRTGSPARDELHADRSPRRRRGRAGDPERRRLARAGRGRVRACPRRRAAASLVRRRGRPGSSSNARRSAAYCRWRQAEALVAAGAPAPRRPCRSGEAYAVAARIGARPLLRELELLAERARLDLAPPGAGSSDAQAGLEEILGLTPREAEVLALVARGYTNREIATELVISVRTAGVHVSHILSKLGAPNRIEAAAIAHRLTPPHAPR